MCVHACMCVRTCVYVYIHGIEGPCESRAALILAGNSEGTIAMAEGEVLHLIEEDKGDGWTRVRRNDGEEGYVPTSYVKVSIGGM